MKSKYDQSLANVLVHEGGIVNHPADPGGLTNQGVTQRVYDLYRKAHKQPARSVRSMTTAERNAIYRQNYWDVIRGDDLPAGIDYVVFDGSVNSGPVQSVKWLQRALGSAYGGKIDGLMGPATLAAVAANRNNDALVAAICARRMAFLKALKTWKTFGKGWTARVTQVEKVGQAWASGETAPAVAHVEYASIKADIADAKSPPSKAPADLATGGGVMSGVLSQATDQLTPYGYIDFVGKAIAVLTVVGVAVAVGGIGYRYYAKYKADKLADALDTKAS